MPEFSFEEAQGQGNTFSFEEAKQGKIQKLNPTFGQPGYAEAMHREAVGPNLLDRIADFFGRRMVPPSELYPVKAITTATQGAERVAEPILRPLVNVLYSRYGMPESQPGESLVPPQTAQDIQALVEHGAKNIIGLPELAQRRQLAEQGFDVETGGPGVFAAKTAGEVVRQGAETLTPGNVASVVAGGANPLLNRAVLGGFLAQTVPELPNVVEQATQQPTPENIAKALLFAGGARLMNEGLVRPEPVERGPVPTEPLNRLRAGTSEMPWIFRDRQFNMPDRPTPIALLPEVAGSEAGRPVRFVGSPIGQQVDLSQLTEVEARELLRGPRTFEPFKQGQPQFEETPPLIGQRPLRVEQKVVTGPQPKTFTFEEGRTFKGEPKQGGQISFEGEGVPSAMQAKEMVPPFRGRVQIGLDPTELRQRMRTAIEIGNRLLIGQRGETHADTLLRYGYKPEDYPHEFSGRGYVVVDEKGQPVTLPGKTKPWLDRFEGLKVGNFGEGDAANKGLDSSQLPGFGEYKALRSTGMSEAEIEQELSGGPKEQESVSQKLQDEVNTQLDKWEESPYDVSEMGFPSNVDMVKEAQQLVGKENLIRATRKFISDLEHPFVGSEDVINLFARLVVGKSPIADRYLKGPKNAIRELRTDSLPQAQAPGDLQTMGEEVREGTGAQGQIQEAPVSGQEGLQRGTGPSQGVVGFTQKGANIKQLIATYTGRGGKREAVLPGSIEKMHPDDLRQVYQQLEALHKERTKGGVATEKGQEALTQEGALWSEIRNRLFRVGLRQGENVANFSLDELQQVKEQLVKSLDEGNLQQATRTQFQDSLLKVNDLIKEAQPKSGQGGKLYGGLPIFDPDLWKGAKELFDKASTIGVNRQRASALLDAADAKAKLSGREKGNRIRVALKDEVDQNALTFLAEAGGDKGKLNTFASQVSGKNKVAEVAIGKAISDFDRLQPHAKALADQLEQQRQRENKADVATDFIANYMKHALETEDTGLFDPGPSGQGVSTSFLKPRSYPNYATAIEKGEKPKTLNAAKLLESRVAAGEKLINRQAWVDQLKKLKTSTGEPFATDLVKRKGKGLTAPEGYVTKELAPGVRAAVHKEYEGLINALTGESFVKNSTVGSILLGVEGGLKHGLLLFDSYHAFRMMRKELFQIGKISYNKGVSLLEYDKPTVQRLVQSGDLEPKMAKWIEDNRAKKDLLVANGLNVGRIAEALFENKIRKELKVAGVDVNIPGRFNRWVFEKVTRGAMLEAGLREFDRTKKMHPDWTDDQVAAHVAKQENVYFGNLQRQGILKSQSARDVAQIVFLAPQWVESMVQTEARGAKQIMTAPFDSVMKRRLMLGSIGKGVGAGVIAYFVANQVINIMSQGQPTWENEDGHKLDAKLPGGYWLSPMNDVAEITHDYIRYGKQGKGPIESTAQIVGNKMSPLGRAAQTAFQGRDYSGVKLSDTGRLKEAAKSLIPTPLPLAGLQSEVPKQTGRQLYSTFGLKVEPDLRPHQDAVEKAGGKKVSEMDLGERFISEFEAAKTKKKLTPEQEAHAAEVSRLNIGKRGTELQAQLDKADRQWLQSRKLSLPGFDNKIKSGGTSVYLTDAETKRMSQLMLENYKAVIPILREQYDDLDEPEERQALFSEATKAARQLARDQMLEEMSNSKNESNKSKKFQLFK